MLKLKLQRISLLFYRAHEAWRNIHAYLFKFFVLGQEFFKYQTKIVINASGVLGNDEENSHLSHRNLASSNIFDEQSVTNHMEQHFSLLLPRHFRRVPGRNNNY